MEHSLLFISRLDIYIVEALADIKLSKVLGPMELQDKFRDQEEEVLILDYYSIKRVIVLN